MTEEQGAQQLPDANTDKKSFGKDVGKLVSGTVIAQVVGICLIPIITRIFSPEIYGLAAIFTSIVSILTVVSCLRYELAILLPKEDKDAGSVFCACLAVLFCFSIVLIPVFFFFGDNILSLFNGPELSPYVMLIPLLVFIDGLYLALRYWNTRKKRFGTQATTQVIQSLSGNGLKLGFGLGGLVNAGSLIIAQILGQTLGTLILFFQMIRYDAAKIRAGCSLTAIKAQMVRYKKFPQYNIWGALLNTISWQIPIFMLTAFFSSTVTGLYALGMTMIQLPMSLIGNSISQVYLQRASIAKYNNTLPILVRETTSTLFILSILPFFLLSLIGGDLFGIVFGTEWKEAGTYVQILGVWAMVWFITSALGPTAVVLEKQEINLVYNIILVITRFLSILIGGLYGNIYLALILFSVSGLIVYGGIGCLYVFIWSKVSMREIWDRIKKPCIVSIILGMIVFVLSLTSINSVLLCVLAILCEVGYIIYIFKTQEQIRAYIGK